ncbi:MAG TPA: SWIM zinc finger family protein [Bacillota bacterium]|nr:SWIM zinc finger family protein [Bacillota bacterium]
MWKNLFQEHILARGIDYYHRNLVENVNNEGGQITGIVSGTRDYDVEIIKENEEIVNLSCTCPYAASGNSCKHMAAVLFYVENDVSRFKMKDKEDSIKEFVEEVNIEVLKDFVVDLFLQNKRLFNRFKNIARKEVSPADLLRCKNHINDIFWDYVGYDGFIDYENAYNFTIDLIDVLKHDVQNMVDIAEWDGAFEITKYLLIKLGNQSIDDSGGSIWSIIHHCIEIWEQIVDQCNIDVKRKMFRSLLEMIDGKCIEYQEYFIDDIEQFIFDHFTEVEFLRSKKKRLDVEIKMHKKKNNSSFKNYKLNQLCLRKVKILEELQMDLKEIENYCNEYRYLDEVRKYYIDVCIQRNNYEQAISLLKEGKNQKEVNLADLIFYSTQLKDLYKQLNMEKLYKDKLWQLLIKYNKGDIEVFRELKSLYVEKDWLEKREFIFNELADKVNISKLYREEGLYDRLIEVVMDSYDLSMVREHEDVLKDFYPEKLLEKYEKTVRKMATLALGRQHYRKIVSILRDMEKYSGGRIKISKIITDWRKKYTNRPAMMDELNKLQLP